MKFIAAILALGAALFAPMASAGPCGEACQAVADAAKPDPAAQDYEPSPAIWKLSDGDTTIYMFGTYHVLPEGFRWRSEPFDAIAASVDELVLETSSKESEATMDPFMLGVVVQAMTDRERLPVSKRLSQGNREKWFKLGKYTDLPRNAVDRMPLILSLLGVGVALAEEQGSLSEYGVETVLEAEFTAAVRPIGSIESSVDVMTALLGIEEDLLVADLDAELTKWDGKDVSAFFDDFGDTGSEAGAETDPDEAALDRGLFADEHDWARGIANSISLDDFGDTEFGREMYKVMLTDRNRAWAQWLEQRLEQPGSILLAVGAGHFEGADSVQVMLAERGLTAERIH